MLTRQKIHRFSQSALPQWVTPLMALPAFVLAGALMDAGISERLVDVPEGGLAGPVTGRPWRYSGRVF
ncbi:hypothetical protein O9993_01130 [Vibrio lentus]|nr:hypothetical protein [Vibrio lentus]